MACDICHGINSDQCPCCGHQHQYHTCKTCNGYGKLYYAISVKDGHEFTVDSSMYDILAENIDAAMRRNEFLYKGEVERCPDCYGEGEVEDEEPDPDEYLEREYEERRIEEALRYEDNINS